MIFERDPFEGQSNGIEPPQTGLQGSAPNLSLVRARLARIIKRNLRANLPARINSIRNPWDSHRFGKVFFPLNRFLSRVMIGNPAHRGFGNIFALPNRGHSNQIRIETGPKLMSYI